jgi:hypothetical protein
MAAHSSTADSDMPIHHKKASALFPAPVLPVACGDIVFLEDVVAGARVDIALTRDVYPGIQVTLEYTDGDTRKTFTTPLKGGLASFLIPAGAFIHSLWAGMRIRYWVDDPFQASEMLDLGVSTRL